MLSVVTCHTVAVRVSTQTHILSQKALNHIFSTLQKELNQIIKTLSEAGKQMRKDREELARGRQ